MPPVALNGKFTALRTALLTLAGVAVSASTTVTLSAAVVDASPVTSTLPLGVPTAVAVKLTMTVQVALPAMFAGKDVGHVPPLRAYPVPVTLIAVRLPDCAVLLASVSVRSTGAAPTTMVPKLCAVGVSVSSGATSAIPIRTGS